MLAPLRAFATTRKIVFLIKLIGIPLAVAVFVAGLVSFGAILRAWYLRRVQPGTEGGFVRAAFAFYKRIWVVYASFLVIAFVYIIARSIWELVTTGRTPW
jgi:hypothetical protein